MDYYIVAGETSGDLHGANLIYALKEQDPNATFRIVGGDKMEAASTQKAVLHTSQMSFMGFIEVLLNIRSILKNLKNVKADLLRHRPDALILIDFPGFNLKLAAFAKQHDIKVFYYISPKVWAWNTKRVKKIKRIVDHLFCILPFEVGFYDQWGMKVDYVGNPLLDAVSQYRFNSTFKEANNLINKPIIALLPGSRKMEISKLLPEMMKVVKLFPGHHFAIAGAPNFDQSYYEQFMHGATIPVIFDQTYDLLNNAEAAVVASGTATLETALLHIPQVVVYKANAVSIAIARRVIKVDYISLVNLIMDREVVKELIQNAAHYDAIAEELDQLLNNRSYRERVLADYNALAAIMGEPGASSKTAKLIDKYLK
ncbi:lipid-A-disaccharide synthase [Olivibacter domesticus]|uniref:Lipid-A-disaccharide synthase n=1 Tax=Olivibacter domesticus TaxID=407022 RepID=A0A1H7XF80_OLID1|nr:lipid-A-disaccharide synthase [Olivibacter domesticus]SEM32274.1 lipid-A-disaccharide synthase [Olivibacter domesticus]